jgi:hypothetical protein
LFGPEAPPDKSTLKGGGDLPSFHPAGRRLATRLVGVLSLGLFKKTICYWLGCCRLRGSSLKTLSPTLPGQNCAGAPPFCLKRAGEAKKLPRLLDGVQGQACPAPSALFKGAA